MRHVKRTLHRGRGRVPGVGPARVGCPAGARWQRWGLNIGAVLGSLCLVFAALTLLFGVKPLIFASGSMGPGIPTGSLGLAIATPAADVLPGQVVSVVTSDGTRVTHRVVSKSPDGGLVLKGDANAVADLQPYTAQTVDKLFFNVPVLGFVAGALGQPWVYFLGGLLCAVLVYVAFLRKEGDHGAGTGGSPGADKGNGSGQGALRPPAPGQDPSARASLHNTGPVQRLADWGRYSSLSVPATAPAGGLQIARRLVRGRALQGTVAVLAALALGLPAGLAVRAEPTMASFTGSAGAHAGVTALLLPTVPGALSCQTTTVLVLVGADLKWDSAGLPSGTRYVVEMVGSDKTAYLDAGTAQAARLSGALSLLASVFAAKENLDVKILTAITVNNAAAAMDGSNILWKSDDKGAPSTKVRFTPGLLAVSYECIGA